MTRCFVSSRNKVTKITLDNLILIINNDCPRDYADCAIRCLDRRGPVWVESIDYSECYPAKIPRYSAFIGQLGRIRP